MKVKSLPVKSGDRYLIPGDIHFGIEDPAALSLLTKAGIDAGCNGMILIGDTFDSYGISRHPKSAKVLKNRKRTTVAEEKESAEPWFRSWANNFDNLHMLSGNHEAWFSYIQDQFPGLADTEWWDLYGSLFDGWHLHSHGTALRLGPLLICHGDELRGSLAKNSASSVLNSYPGQNTLYGHTHRVDSSTRPTWKYGTRIDHGAWTIGCMMDLETSQDNRETRVNAQIHQQGGAIVSFDTSFAGDLTFGVEIIQVLRDSGNNPGFVFRGNSYSCEASLVP
jgi:hypothetical protein